MSLSPAERRMRFLKYFFSADNHNLCTMDSIFAQASKHDRIRPWAERMIGDQPEETILPFVDRKTKAVTWYGLAFSDVQFHRLGEHLNHFIGPSYSTFDGRRGSFDRAIPIEIAVNKITEGRAYRFQADNESIWKALELMRLVWSDIPGRKREIPRQLGRVLREFYLALQVGNRQNSEELLAFMVQQRFLTAQNEQFLQVALLQAFHDWQGLRKMMEDTELLRIRRPLHVTGALIEAVYQLELSPFETGDPNDAELAIAHFREVVWMMYQPLYATVGNLNSPDVLKSLMLRAVAIEPQNANLCKELLQMPVPPLDRVYMQQIAAHMQSHEVETIEPIEYAPLIRAKRLAERGRFDEALAILVHEPNSYERTMQLFVCAFELQTLEAKEAALGAFLNLDADETELFLRFRLNREYITELEAEFAPQDEQIKPQLPRNWVEWLEQLDQRGPLANRQLAEQGAREWSPEEMFATDEDVTAFVRALESCYEPDTRKESLNYAFPHLLTFFQQDQRWPRPELTKVYLGLLRALTLTANGGEDELQVFCELTTALLENGLSKQDYKELIDFAVYLWDSFGSVGILDWALELLEMLVVFPCSESAKRLELLYAIDGQLPRLQDRVTAEQWQTLKRLYRDLEQEEQWTAAVKLLQGETLLESQEQEARLLDKLQGKTVGLYTLNENAATRIKETLEEQVQGIRVIVNCDKVGSDALRHLSRMSDILVVTWASAKHAATIFIKNCRPSDLPTLFPRGKGSASVVSVLREYLSRY